MSELKTLTVRVRPSVKRAALRRAKEKARSLANYLERRILADAQRTKA
jgi:predicted HicB family RNase H-like nuclease